ncbi:hypothetical protein C4J81_17575 [Deltaproteobacteria bacterium Smac51]|nr:hypothetical protein C4J81_17575 [Deltaproteobacteria bacterium Smac51]
MKKFDESRYLADMYRDSCFPGFLVDKVKESLAKVVSFLEKEPQDMAEVQARFDECMNEINEPQAEFEDNDSEIETGARESIGETVSEIIKHFGLDLDAETAMSQRDF